ncbi:MAG: hypothetical protein ACLPND_06700, partial [Candidatus Korobacteraceae bacterium]
GCPLVVACWLRLIESRDTTAMVHSQGVFGDNSTGTCESVNYRHRAAGWSFTLNTLAVSEWLPAAPRHWLALAQLVGVSK